ncbi:MAG: DUF2267 domain-containing protein [Rhizobiales bacterium]|nr:DUF2267 domain-containing protein [Hyphomicrobiales bacterium]
MDELIGRIEAAVGLDESTARSAVRIILSFLYQEGDRDKVMTLIERLPGAESYVETSSDDSSATLGGLGGLMGGGAMAVLGQLQGLGLGMAQIQGVTQETVNFARERAGADIVNDVVASIPGLGQFV